MRSASSVPQRISAVRRKRLLPVRGKPRPSESALRCGSRLRTSSATRIASVPVISATATLGRTKNGQDARSRAPVPSGESQSAPARQSARKPNPPVSELTSAVRRIGCSAGRNASNTLGIGTGPQASSRRLRSRPRRALTAAASAFSEAKTAPIRPIGAATWSGPSATRVVSSASGSLWAMASWRVCAIETIGRLRRTTSSSTRNRPIDPAKVTMSPMAGPFASVARGTPSFRSETTRNMTWSA